MKLAASVRAKKTSVMEAMTQARREVPESIRKKRQPLHSSLILKSDDVTLSVYKGKPYMNVLLLSTVNAIVLDDNVPENLLILVTFYNSTKIGP